MKHYLILTGLSLLILICFAGCDSVPLTAPTDSSIVLTANPEEINTNSGQSVITAMVTDADGNPVANGTTIYFSTTLGTLDKEESETTNGIAKNVLHAGSMPGEATIRAQSGGITANVPVWIGGKPAEIMILNATPSAINVGGTSQITCTLLTASGYPVPGQPVFFTADNGTLQSAGSITYTDQNGQAFDLVTAEFDLPDTDPPEGVHGFYITVTAHAPSSDSSESQYEYDSGIHGCSELSQSVQITVYK